MQGAAGHCCIGANGTENCLPTATNVISMKKILFTVLSFVMAHNIVAQDGNVGIGTNTPQARLHVADSSVLFSAQGGNVPPTAGNTPVSGAGRRMMWYPAKAAFRVGAVVGNNWNKDSIGAYSFASGHNTKATGIYAVAMGESTEAGNTGSIASGRFSTASGEGAAAIGTYINATGLSSFAAGFDNLVSADATSSLGAYNTASGHFATAVGGYNQSTGEYASTMGGRNRAGGSFSTALGGFNSALGHYSTALGQNSFAGNAAATAIGYMDTATGNTSLALGGGLYARSWGEVVVGTYNADYTAQGPTGVVAEDRVFVVGNGSSPTNRKNAITVLKNGNVGIGKLNPAATLDVMGGISALTDIATLGGDITTVGGNIRTQGGSITADLGHLNIAVGNVNVPVGSINVGNGNVNVTNGTVKQKNYSQYLSSPPNVFASFVWTHNLGYTPVIMLSLEKVGAGPNSIFAPFYRVINSNQIEIGLNNSNNSTSFNCYVHWIVVN
ncbi:MAG: hypothetical protein EOP51_17105 [Sphingobacteriales bacterium]|nr:MAG: hypothetical protein EOP51_17105 [Sphingobacteriales bacterium]